MTTDMRLTGKPVTAEDPLLSPAMFQSCSAAFPFGL